MPQHFFSIFSELIISGCVGDVDLTQVAAKKCTVSVSLGKVSLIQTAGTFNVTSSLGGIVINEHEGETSITNSSGKIEATRLLGKEHSLKSSLGSVSVSQSEGKVRVKTETGAIHIDLPKVASTLRAESSLGAVSVNFPTGFAPDIEVTKSLGKIISSLPVKIVNTLSDFSETDQKGLVSISTKMGRIKISENERHP